MSKYINAELLLQKIKMSRKHNLEIPLLGEDLSNPEINNYDKGQEETFDTVIRIIKNLTEESTMKIDVSKITENVAVHCSKVEYIKPLFEAWGFNDIERGENCSHIYGQDTCFVNRNDYWEHSSKDYWEYNDYTIIEFTDLIIPESNLAKVLGVQEDQEFKYRIDTLRVHNGRLQYRNYCSDWKDDTEACDVYDMINHPELIKPLPKWTEEEQKMARKDSYRFKYVARDGDGAIFLFETQPVSMVKPDGADGKYYYSIQESIEIEHINYPSLQPGECVALEEIAGGK